MKGISVSFVTILMVVIIAIALAITTGHDIIDSAKTSSRIKYAEELLKKLDNYINEVVSEGNGSARILKIVGDEHFETLEDNSLEYKIEQNIFDYSSRQNEGNLMYIANGDSHCYEADANNDGAIDLVMENSHIKIAMRKVNRTKPLLNISTNNSIILITEKTLNQTLYPSDSTIMLDSNTSTASGNGYSEILMTGENLARCVIHFYVNSTIQYDVYYTLYSGSDFLTIEVRNVR